jgi:hypothetical protein
MLTHDLERFGAGHAGQTAGEGAMEDFSAELSSSAGVMTTNHFWRAFFLAGRRP